MQNIYEDYAIIEAKIKTLKNIQDEMRVKILEEMVKKDEKKIETPVGSFSVSMRKTWEYPPEITKKEEDLKAAKAKAESVGTATFMEIPSLRFTAIKI